MIKLEFINDWRKLFPWIEESQVEQDLILSKSVVLIFEDEYLAQYLVMLGGTAIYKLIYMKPIRYSEDIDLALVKFLSKEEIKKLLVESYKFYHRGWGNQ